MPDASLHLAATTDVAIPELLQGTTGYWVDLDLDGDVLRITYRPQGLRARTSDPVVLSLALDDLQAAELKRRPRHDRLVLHPRRLGPIEAAPGPRRLDLPFRVAPRHRAQAEAFVGALRQGWAKRPPGQRSMRFSLPQGDSGLTESIGLCTLDDEHLILDVLTGLSGGTQKELQIVKVEPGALAAVELETGLLRDRLVLEPRTTALFDALPGRHKNVVTLRLPRRCRADAEHLVYALRRRRAALRPPAR